MRKMLGMAVVAMMVLLARGPLCAQDVNTAIELLRSDVQAKKKESITKAMNLTEKEAEAFWPLYRDFENDLAKIGDERLALIKDYAANYTSMTDAKASELIKRLFALDKKRLDLKQNYFTKMSKALSPRIAARFIQAENYLIKLIDLSIGGEVPLMPKTEESKPAAPAGEAAK